MKKIIGIKKGMTQIYVEDRVVPVTVIEVPKNKIFKKDEGKKGILIRMGIGKKKKMNKPEKGMYKKVGYAPKRFWDV